MIRIRCLFRVPKFRPQAQFYSLRYLHARSSISFPSSSPQILRAFGTEIAQQSESHAQKLHEARELRRPLIGGISLWHHTRAWILLLCGAGFAYYYQQDKFKPDFWDSVVAEVKNDRFSCRSLALFLCNQQLFSEGDLKRRYDEALVHLPPGTTPPAPPPMVISKRLVGLGLPQILFDLIQDPEPKDRDFLIALASSLQLLLDGDDACRAEFSLNNPRIVPTLLNSIKARSKEPAYVACALAVLLPIVRDQQNGQEFISNGGVPMIAKLFEDESAGVEGQQLVMEFLMFFMGIIPELHINDPAEKKTVQNAILKLGMFWASQKFHPSQTEMRELAGRAFEVASMLEPQNPTIRVVRGEEYLKQNKYRLAVEQFQEALRLDPGEVDAALQLAGLMTRTYQGKKPAPEHEQRAISILTSCLNHAKARKRFSEITKKKSYSKAYQILVNLTDKRSTSDALKISKEWVKLMPDDTEAHAAVGRCLFKTKAYKEALKEYQTAQEANPSYDYAIANCYFQLGNLSEASKWAQVALSKAEKNSIPKSPSITDSLPSFAPTPLQDAKKQDPRELPNVLYLLSDIHKKQGDYTIAYDHITRYLTLLPKEPRGYMSQVSLLKKLNRQHESYGVLSNVLSLWMDSCSSGSSSKERTARCREYFAIHKVELKALKEIGEHCKTTVPADEVEKLQMCKKYETLKSVYVGS